MSILYSAFPSWLKITFPADDPGSKIAGFSKSIVPIPAPVLTIMIGHCTGPQYTPGSATQLVTWISAASLQPA